MATGGEVDPGAGPREAGAGEAWDEGRVSVVEWIGDVVGVGPTGGPGVSASQIDPEEEAFGSKGGEAEFGPDEKTVVRFDETPQEVFGAFLEEGF